MSRNVHTLGNDDDKPSRRRSNSSDDENSDEGRQGFFVGGSDRSGQEVLGPNPRDNASEHLFEAIRRAGAERLTEEEALNTHQPSGTTGATAPMAFRLGGHGVGTEQVGGTSATTTTGSSARQQPVIVRLVFWTNGFTVDDGPLRQFQDPKNQIFLQAVLAKRIPPELTLAKPGREIDLRIEKKSKDYEEPKTKPFSGQGNQLGTITPHVSGAAGGDVVFVDAPPKLSDEETVKLVEQAQAELKVDDALPTTRIQIRIPDTVRPIVARLNQTQTVNQLRIFIVTADPTLAYRPFRLMTSYPIQPIEDEALTVKEAGLLNATVLVKFE